MKYAYTTGTYATGAVKGALLRLIQGVEPSTVEVRLPQGGLATIPIERLRVVGNTVECSVVKLSSEKDDITHNLEIIARVSLRADARINIEAGCGIGVVSKKGLPVPPGSAAINPTPRGMIKEAVRELTHRGVDIVLSAPRGREIAPKTWNPKLGIEGGISIIGTTGIMKPKSAPAYKESILAQLRVIQEESTEEEVVIAPGNISERAILELLPHRVSEGRILQAGDFIGFSLKEAAKVAGAIVVVGHPAKLAKLIDGYFQTHYSRSPHAKHTVLRFFERRLPPVVLKELRELPTVEGMIQVLKQKGLLAPLGELAHSIEETIKDYLGWKANIPVLLFDMDRELIGLTQSAKEWIEKGST